MFRYRGFFRVLIAIGLVMAAGAVRVGAARAGAPSAPRVTAAAASGPVKLDGLVRRLLQRDPDPVGGLRHLRLGRRASVTGSQRRKQFR